jgi:hypothetical protein
MKKFLTLVLALVLVFGLTVPAMAFTSDTDSKSEVPYDLSIYLVEYDSDSFVGLAGMPEADRGYAKNEIVAAVVELYVPKNSSPAADGYTELVFTGDNVSLNVTDNGTPLKTNVSTAVAGDFSGANANKNSIEFTALSKLATGSSSKTWKFMYFAKVTDDEAMLKVKLVDGTAADAFAGNTLLLTLGGDDYLVVKNKASGSSGYYTIYCNFEDNTAIGTFDNLDNYKHAIRIYVDKNNKSTGMAIKYDSASGAFATLTEPAATLTALGVNTSGQLGWVDGAVIKTSGDVYNHVMDVYEDIVEDVFGMDYFLIGNYVRDSFFTDLVSADTVIATVDIEPWTAYVSVPDNIVVDPPKTGDAASIMGFVMVALSGAGAVALKKRG